jgi:hypothetical protein
VSGEQHVALYAQSMDSGMGQSCRGCLSPQALGYLRASVPHGRLDAWRKVDLPIVPKKSARKIDRQIHEPARDQAREIAKADAQAASTRATKKIAMQISG